MPPKKKAPAAKKTTAKKAPAPAAKKAPKPKPPEAVSDPVPATTFKEVRSWSDCNGRVIKVYHPSLGTGYHKAKVLSVNIAEGTVLVSIALDKATKGRFLLPLDATAAQVK